MGEIDDLYKSLAEFIGREVQSLVHQWRMLISKNFYQCSIDIFKGLADMYI